MKVGERHRGQGASVGAERPSFRGVTHTFHLRDHALLLMVITLVSMSGLIFEIALTRIFSLFFQYHFAFLAISVAVLGLSAGAVIGSMKAASSGPSDLRKVLFFLSVSFPVVAAALAWSPSMEIVWVHAVVALVPFIFIGLFMAWAFSQYAPSSGFLYGADLIGAALGVLAAFTGLSVMSAFTLIILTGFTTGLAALAYSGGERSSGKQHTVLVLLFLLACGILVSGNERAQWISYQPSRWRTFPRDKSMLHVLNNPAQGAKIVHTAWGPFARVDVVETRYPDEKLVFTDGGAGSLMLRFQGDLEELAEYRRTVEFMPFGIGTGEDALIIGAGSGYDVLLALLGGAREVTAVEVNPAILAATRRFNDFNGGILDHPQIEWIQGEARTFVEWTDETYDLIYLNLVYTQAVEPANLALVENYIFTQEAFQAYINHLAPGGHLAIVSHNALEGSRAALTALSALAASGEIPLRNALDHISLWMIHQEDPTLRKSVLVVGRQSLREETISTLINLAERRSMTPLFVPKRFEFPFAPLRKGTSMLEFIEEDAPYDLSPTFDDRPYFFDLDPGLPPPVKQALWVSGGFSLAILVVSLGVVLLRSKRAELLEWGALILYTVLIGIGFMLVEIPLIHQFQLLLGFPVLSFSIVLGTLMLGAGLGSLVSQRWEDVNLLARVSVTAVGVGLGAVAYAFLLPDLLNMLLPASILWRITAACVITFVLGVFMGVPFPSLLRLTSRKRGRVGLLWAINGAFSVVGSTLAVVVSMSMGYQWAFVIGGGSYFLVAALSMYIQRLLY